MTPWHVGRALVRVVFVAMIVGGARLLTAQPGPLGCRCATNAQAEGSGYGMRGNRCEGLLRRPVKASAVATVVSFTEWFEEFDTRVRRQITLEWTVPDTHRIHLSASGHGPLSSYRMDTDCAPRGRSYGWPIDMLGSLRLSKKDIGVLASARYRIGSEDRPVLVPLRLSQQRPPIRARTYQLVILPHAEIREVMVRVVPLNRDGSRPSAGQYTKLDRSYYPAAFPIAIPIPRPSTAGLHLVEIGLVRPRSGTQLLAVTFYNSGR